MPECEKINKAIRKRWIELIGPGGKNEIKKAIAKNWIPISLGESRLRTETAGLVAVNLVSFINQ